MSASTQPYIEPQWPVDSVSAYSTTRLGGYGIEPYNTFNLGEHVGDNPATVLRNRAKLITDLQLPDEPVWLEQVHGTEVVYATNTTHRVPRADAAWTDQQGCVLSIMTADCLPVLFASRGGEVVAVAHAGWRGLAAGVLQNTVARLPAPPEEIIAWLGPAIGPRNFEVGEDVLTEFRKVDPGCDVCFIPSPEKPEKYYADIFLLCRRCLASIGVKDIFGEDQCTFGDKRHFFSHRRDAGKTGRMASLIWIP